MSAREELTRAAATIRHVLREPGALSERSVALLRVAVLPQIEAMLEHGAPSDAAAFLRAALAALGPDPELERIRAGLQRLSIQPTLSP